jgi:hypothetical protein
MRLYSSEHRETLAALGVLIGLTLLFFRPVIFSGMHYITPDVREPAGATAPLSAALREGTFPLWNPYILSGMPSFASLMLVPYLPASWIDLIGNLLFTPPRRFALVFHFLLAGLGTFVYLRWHKADVAAALLGGLAFQFSVDLVNMAASGHDTKLMTLAYLPWALWSVERLLAHATPARSATLALVLGLQLLSTHVQMAYYTWLVVGLFVLYWSGRLWLHRQNGLGDRRAMARRLAWLGAALIVGLALSAVIYLPVVNYAPYSIRGGAGGLAAERAGQWSLPPWELLTFVAPHLFGFGDVTYWGALPFTNAAFYSGIIVLALATVAVCSTLRSHYHPITQSPNHRITHLLSHAPPPIPFLILLTFVSLVLACGDYLGPIFTLLRTSLPFYNAFRAPTMALALAEFALAVLAGLGAHRILTARRAAPGWLARAAGGLALVAILTIALGDWLFALIRPLYPSLPSLDAAAQQALDRARFQMMLRDTWMIAFCLGGAALLTWGYLSVRIGKLTFAALLIALMIADLWRVDSELNHPQPFAALREPPTTAAVAQLLRSDSDLSRVLPLQHLFNDNRWAAYSIFSAGGYHGAKLQFYQNFLDAFGLPNQVNPRALALLNVRWVLSPDALDLPGLKSVEQATLVYNGMPTNVRIYRNTGVMPRAWLVDAYRTVKDDAAALDAIGAGDFDPAREVVLLMPPSIEPRPGAPGQAVVENYALHEIVLRVRADTPRLLVLSEVYYPRGWQALVDDVPAPILPADYLLRAVALEAGEHRVVFRFDPWDVRIGLWISLAAALVVALGYVIAVRQRLSDQKAKSQKAKSQ